MTILYVFLLGYVGFIIYAIATPDLTKYPTIQLNSSLTLGNSTDTEKVNYIKYNENKKIVETKLTINNGKSTTDINSNKYYFTAKTINNDPIKLKVIQTTDKDFVLLINNIKPNFKTLLIKIYLVRDSNKTLDIVNDSDNPDSSSTENTLTDNNYPSTKLYISKEDKFTNNKLAIDTPVNFSIQSTKSNIKDSKQKIKDLKVSIKKLNQAIYDVEVQVDKIDKDKAYRTDEQNEKAIEDRQ
ncbi:hypothetical protein [Enterococcus sp. CSURQ0835]|uniref:hypothetical protein n=1 Tax=Enterococcus sp. CSURQ0835 TaxID=2681394 RepID=UPI001357B03A|nr:hypothetical protein [Enterococcus sp. CSURQ0835]